ncbi:MAG: UPF0182 family protein [Eubacteriales bacterium]|nr:UPF0182 family protein [Eubacteriales bacterium]
MVFGRKGHISKKPAGKRDIRKMISIVILIAVAIMAVLSLGADFITDWMWFSEMGYLSVFFKELKTKLIIGIPLFLILGFFIDVYLRKIKLNYFDRIASKEITDMKMLSRNTNIAAGVFSFIVTVITVNSLWFKSLTFSHSTSFHLKDPLFHNDISFYVFKLDFLEALNSLLITVIFLFILLTVIYYVILITVHTPESFKEYEADREESSGGSEFSGGHWANTPLGRMWVQDFGRSGSNRRWDFRKGSLTDLMEVASAQLTFLGVVFFLMLAVHFFLRQYDLLQAHTGAVYGAGYTDIKITLTFLRILAVLSIAGAALLVMFVKKKRFKKALIVPAIMVCVFALGIGVEFLVQGYVVSPDELNKEYPYLERNIKYTQNAYQLNKVKINKFGADNDLTDKDIADNQQTIKNVRINDYLPVKDFYNQTQSIRQYYTFHDVDVDRYKINGELTQTYLGVREVEEDQTSKTWLNSHIKYTHGYGFVMSRVDTVTASGQPEMIIKNIPPISSVKGISIDQPRVYFGEKSNSYSLVNTGEDEFDYPDGSDNKYTRYEGKAGIRMTPFAKLMFAIREKNLKILVSTNINSDSKILIYKNVLTRVKRIMPKLKYVSDPYAVTANGRIYWIVDAFTSSNNYPYSEPYSGQTGTENYIRNSVKVVVDAYDGSVDFYVVDENDPIAETYRKIYPKLFKTAKKMPNELREHMRYPSTLLQKQAKIYTHYHMNDVKVFYQQEDMWDVAHEIYGTDERTMRPGYFIVKLPGEKEAEFISSIPFTPKTKKNMTALMIARNDGDNYGELVLYQFPKSKTVYGPMQVEAQIDQNPEISQDFSLWSQSGSKYSRGNLFVVPVKSSLLYVEPIYLEASNSAIPEVKRVAVVYNDKIAYKSTFGDALKELFGTSGGTTTSDSAASGGGKSGSGGSKTRDDYIKDAKKAYDNAQDALKSGDWSKYGKYMDQLEKDLNKL